jgi:hypothetical protein
MLAYQELPTSIQWWRGHGQEAKEESGRASQHEACAAMGSLLLPYAAPGVSLLAVSCLSGATPRGQPRTPAVPLPQGRDGLRARRMVVWWTCRAPSLYRHVHRECMRNAMLDVTPIVPATAYHRRSGSCPCRLRINLPGSPVDWHRGKKAGTRELSWPPSGPLSPGDALAAGPPDTRHRLRSPPCALSHHHSLLTDLGAAARAAHGRAAPRAASRPGPSVQRPWRASAAASVWLSRCPWSVRVGATADVSWHGANRNCSTPDTRQVVAARFPRISW